MIVRIKLQENAQMPTKGTEGSAGYDCYAYENKNVCTNSPTLISLGFSIEIPKGYHAKILPRSSTGKKTPLRMSNSCGIIDSDYRGIVHAMYECSEKGYLVEKGERICQMLIEKNCEVELQKADGLSETERGENGFGSTGK